ncbi:conserved hypothetical protein [Phycicoccus elongatus Lp2]|uniref:Integral membrane protein n=1 Tax=Phycicoccus elongatus Lp2 TaxID=1193181 RepID=N0DYK7_9MICO|nr:hypothetical protein [Phycicoccus elongatus]CCH69487.1 conserved hypothetical protein [Phycicoccus elongatus Lp2]CCH69491.1 conserved hypothetical protein [Phycicoccus elongatus Lp2]
MNVIYTVLLAFAIGYFVKNRGVASALYLAGGALVFAFQSVTLLIEWASGKNTKAFGDFPDYTASNVWGYGVVNLIITIIGIGLVQLGVWVSHKQAAKKGVVQVPRG